MSIETRLRPTLGQLREGVVKLETRAGRKVLEYKMSFLEPYPLRAYFNADKSDFEGYSDNGNYWYGGGPNPLDLFISPDPHPEPFTPIRGMVIKYHSDELPLVISHIVDNVLFYTDGKVAEPLIASLELDFEAGLFDVIYNPKNP